MVQTMDSSGDAPVQPRYLRAMHPTVPVKAVGAVHAAKDAQPMLSTAGKPPGDITNPDTERPDVKKKSKRKQRQERSQQNLPSSQLCHGLLANNCSHGDSCRYSHDLDPYLEVRPIDLPGSCPFTATGTCPFGITCRWATGHGSFDVVSAKAFVAQAKKKREAGTETETASNTAALRQEAVLAAGSCSVVSPAAQTADVPQISSNDALAAAREPCSTGGVAPTSAAGQCSGSDASYVDDATWSVAAGSLQRSSEVAASVPLPPNVPNAFAASDSAPEAVAAANIRIMQSKSVPEPRQHSEPVAPAEGKKPQLIYTGDAVLSASGARPGVNADESWLTSISVDAIALPVSKEVLSPLNTLDKSVQHLLRKNLYDFAKADGVLQALGLSLGKHTKGKKHRQEAKQQAMHVTDMPEPQQTSDLQHSSGTADERAAKRICLSAPALEQQVAHSNTAAADDTPTYPSTSNHATASVQAGSAADVSADEAAQPEIAHAAALKSIPVESLPAAASEPAVALEAILHTQPESEVKEASNAASAAKKSSSDSPKAAGGDGDAEAKRLFDIKTQAEAGADSREAAMKPAEKRRIDFRGKTYLAPLTTVGNLPFRRLCKGLGVDITCGEMAMATNLCQGQASEWALLKRHPCEDIFGVQVCGGFPDAMSRCCQLIEDNADVSFVDLNFGCPIDIVCNRGAGSALLVKTKKLHDIVRCSSRTLSCPLTIKLRKGFYDGKDIAHELLPQAAASGAFAATLHGRTRQQRYSRLADWDYVQRSAAAVPQGFQLLGNGDVYNWQQHDEHVRQSGVATTMIARGALIKPWIFTEIKEKRHWDISASERFDLLKDFCSFGLTHWGSDAKGVESTRRFLLEWLSFLHRYIPVGLLERHSQAAVLSWRSPGITGRNDLETLLASSDPQDWVRISQRLLGPPPPGFVFAPKHKARGRTEQEMATADTTNG